ncbi:MAG: cation-transporting P-type ATPase [Gammaproteobacteria bacterium]|uniref:cation-transporting P-type ATPase n=1 Tax=Rhodoferax sp. TaxID=50421 RepID=UPI00185F1BB9|nr:cation-transporting P-type ATPase [Rhodoferax sp.]MBU3898851.1 cation-transporting P-type ATPase [Gammaproteobacteria bacterium]MBA3059473.1 cation-transporting P-type ATPase [Rhodoferax sp.]MBU3999042.1 cation-transporting P-type ATPase [Gammaproteobacteria bacterium]MBU4019327.1 cation-transporting P-type ATPase [Gammaproteobacteria bacterium]MBU4081891.1 cation-transporting P-type ATPase [Gammaproteobacteria bacterium]
MPNEHKLSIDNPHALPADEVLRELQANAAGLSAAEATRRLEAVGPNRLPAAPREGLLKRFFKHFHDLLIYILIAAAAVTAVLGHWIDTGVILAVVLVNAVIGFIQEGKAEQALEGIRKMLSAHAHVRRDGAWSEIKAEALVPGDIVRLKSGDRVPADLRLIETTELRVEESALTGESVPSEKNTQAAALDAGVGDRHGMGYSGTMVAAGRGVGVVIATGAATEIGRISKMIGEVETLATPLTRQMTRFGKVLSVVIVGLAALMFTIGWLLHDFTLDELFLSAIGFAVAAIPEGLPAILTITLALGVQRMAGRDAITRRLNAVETLGSVTVICSDKTGTLTKNEMTVRHVVTRASRYDVAGTGYAPQGEITSEGAQATLDGHDDLRALIEVMAVANDSHIQQEDGAWRLTGEPTEGALCTLAMKSGFDAAGYQRVATVPFESENKFMATLDRLPGGGARILLKGAPDRLLARCGLQRGADGASEPLDTGFWEAEIDALSNEGLRVLAAAARDVDDGKGELALDDLGEDLVFLGLVSIIDPPRPEAIAAIKACHTAGIRVKMITGDHAGTASAIGREMGIGGDGMRATTGAEIEAASDEELQQIAHDNDIFARTSPEHKLRLVKALQARGEVVAMTGDGVNDAPALKRADVGVAMGIKGTEATKEAADIVLADDNFSSIERAVEEGRTIYDNLKKAILFILPTNGAQGLVILAAVVFGLVLPLTPVQILWVNMIVAVTLALALAFEPAEPGVMSRPPRDPNAALLDGAFLWRITFVSLLIGGATLAVFEMEQALDMPLDVARTLAVNTLVFGQAFYLFNCRFLSASSLRLGLLFSNRAAWLAVAVLVGLQMLFVYAPFMHRWFGTAALEARHWLVPLAIGLVVFLVIEAEKALLRRYGRTPHQMRRDRT